MSGQNPLRNLGTKELEEFAQNHGFVRPAFPKGDDIVYYNPNDRTKYIKITLNRKDGTPIRTVLSMVRTSGITKSKWWDWFNKKR